MSGIPLKKQNYLQSRPHAPLSKSQKYNASRSTLWRNELGHVNRLRVLNAHRGIEETVSSDDVAGVAGVFKDTAVGENTGNGAQRSELQFRERVR